VARVLVLSSLLAFALLAASSARAHEVRPAVADISVTADQLVIELDLALETLVAGIDLRGVANTDAANGAARYDALRAQPPEALRDALVQEFPRIASTLTLMAGQTALAPQLVASIIPDGIDNDVPRDSRITLRADLPDDGTPVRFGWDAQNGPLIVRQVSGNQEYSEYLTNGAISAPMPRDGIAAKPWHQVFARYVVLGFEHIIPKGLDHILFVLGLFLFAVRLRPLLYQVTAFTLAHTATLALAITGIVRVNPAIVEPLIAASIVFVAVENILFTRMTPWRTAIVFAFGLLHGLGFASVLTEIGLDSSSLVTGLIGFNLGVELGQLAVILAALLLVGWAARKPWYRTYISNPASGAIAVVGAWWFVERVFL